MQTSKLIWEDKYSVKVEQIDLQHKKLFDTVNLLIDILSTVPVQKEKVDEVVT